jgi:hypothetical protein
LYKLADEQINIMMVVDSSDAPNYDAWQNNVYGDGAEVPFDDHFKFERH